jgi:hypothetical protein
MTTKVDTGSRRTVALVALLPLALGLAACGGDDDTATGSGDSSGAGAISIATPSDGAEVGSGFEVKLDTDADLGEPDTGKKHIHLYYDGDTDQGDYDLVYGDSFTVDRDLGEGEHTIKAALANADHSLTGDEDEITVTVGAGAGSGGGGSNDDDSGYDYGGDNDY